MKFSPAPDAAITDPKDDQYGVEPFAKALAKSIADMQAPDGIVIAIDGTWGSGKTSALGMARHSIGVVQQRAWSVAPPDRH